MMCFIVICIIITAKVKQFFSFNECCLNYRCITLFKLKINSKSKTVTISVIQTLLCF